MGYLSRAASHVGGRLVLSVLGGLYLLSVAGYLLLPGIEDSGLGIDLVMALLVGGPGLVLSAFAYRLPETDVRPEFYATIATWCVGAIGVIFGVLFLVEVAAGLRDPIQNVLILTALASLAGLAAGRYDARAKTRTRELELRNRELQRTKAELEETVGQLRTSNERLEQFAYAASHDLQEPLRMVSSYLQLLDARYQDELDDDAREFIAFAVGGADRMRAMVDSLLAYSRISTRGAPLRPTDSGAVFDAVLDDLRGRIERTDATVSSDALPTVTADADQLAQVFRQLLSNALEFSGDESPRVHVGVERDEDVWRFSVADEGIGIESQFHDRVFTVFENLDAPDEATESGAGGIGLALCERIIERHGVHANDVSVGSTAEQSESVGGDIWVESAAGEGATFYFTLPRTADSERDPRDASTALE